MALRRGGCDVVTSWLDGSMLFAGCCFVLDGCWDDGEDDGGDSNGNDEDNGAKVTVRLGLLDAELEALLRRWRSHAGLIVRLRPPRSLDELRARVLVACAGGSGTPGRLSPEPGALCQSVALEVVEVEVVIVIPLDGALAVKREMGIIQCLLGAFFIWKCRDPGLGCI